MALAAYTPSQMRIIKTTVASDTNDSEFDLFMEAARSYGLDPFRKQIHAVVYNKDKPSKRKMTIIVSRDGLRVLAQRCQDYRPASDPATIEYDVDAKGPLNPKGIVRAIVKLFKQDNTGAWYPVIGEAYWDEFAPIKDQWAENEQGKYGPTGKQTLDTSGNWAKMPIIMITKCAESQALRAGWPEQFANIYSEEEMDRLATQTATESVHEFEREQRQTLIGGHGIMMVFDDSATLEKVQIGKVYDRVDEFLKQASPEEAFKFDARNRESLREYWAHDKAAALKLKKQIEKLANEFRPDSVDAA